MYNHLNQYRCTIIRGKSQREIDNLLPTYAKILNEICPCNNYEFTIWFNSELSKYIPNSTRKTLDNHRTEIVGKLFGMYYKDSNGMVFTSDRTNKFLEDNDQPAFFKDVCFKMQFPNGMDKTTTIIERINNQIKLRPYSYLLKVLLYAKNAGLSIYKSDIGYYVLNSLDVLQRKANPLDIIDQISKDRRYGIVRKVITPGKESSYDNQHINEMINYLELANLIIVGQDKVVVINENEKEVVDYFADFWDEDPIFDIYSYDLNIPENRKSVGQDWDYYFSLLSKDSYKFTTTVEALGIPKEKYESKGKNKLIELGDEGELFVYEYEKDRVKSFDNRLAGKVLHLGKTRGLGYDIQSVIAEEGDMAEFVKYIEVKATKRVTEPDLTDLSWVDTINITRNEWVAAQQHKDFYSIFRVYFVRGNVIMYVINDLYKKHIDGHIKVIPMTYRVDFGSRAVDSYINH